MRRFFLLALLLVSLAFQGLAVAAQRLLVEHGGHGHAILHLQEIAHHHHDGNDGVVVDNSAASISHVAGDGALGALAVLPMVAGVDPVPTSNAPPQWQSTFASSPDLAGLRRPPRPTL